MTDILRQLKPASWREIVFPFTGVREYGFAQEQTKHRILFRNNQLIESLGRESPTFVYEIPARLDLAVGPYTEWFTAHYPAFLEACKDTSAGPLYDPIHGEVQAKCVSLRERLAVDRRDGVDLTVEFVQAPDEDDVSDEKSAAILDTLVGATISAGRFDREVDVVHWQQEQPPQPTQDLFTAIGSVSDQLSSNKARVRAQLDKQAFVFEKTQKSIERLKDPETAELRQSARRLQLSSIRLRESATTPPTPTDVVKTVGEIGHMALAARYQMTVEALLSLNPAIARSNPVPSGTQVRVSRRSARPTSGRP